jgi:hypothetical protein
VQRGHGKVDIMRVYAIRIFSLPIQRTGICASLYLIIPVIGCEIKIVASVIGCEIYIPNNKVLMYEAFPWFATTHFRCPSIVLYLACLCSSPNPFGVSIPNM